MDNQSKGFQGRLQRVETLLTALQAADPATRANAEELVQTLLELHGAGVNRMLELVWEGGPEGERLVQEALPADPLVSHLLLLHGLHPLPVETRVQRALDTVRPYMESHGGNVELVSVDDGVVRVRLKGTCGTCPASSVTLRLAVEDAIAEAAPDVVAVEEVKDEVAASDDLPFSLPQMSARALGAEAPTPTSWFPVGGLEALAQRGVRTERLDGHTVLFCRLGDDLYAYDATCPVCAAALGAATVSGTALACPACGQTFDVIRAGRGLDTPSAHLSPLPLLVEPDGVRVALPDVTAS